MSPLAPQVTNTPEDIGGVDFAITSTSKTSTTATFTAPGHTFAVGDVVTISGITPDGYNGTYTITALVAGSTFTVSNSTNATITVGTGDAYQKPNSDYDFDSTSVAYYPNNEDAADIANLNNALAQAAYDAAAAAQADATTALSNAATAQSNATTALANAATAYTTAQNSLQPSAYAIQNPTTKQLTAIDATGLTVYSGASSTSGARVVLNSSGLAGYDTSGTAQFSISASSGAAVFKGAVTGATITGGTLNIAGKTIIDSTGVLTATDVVLTGTITATTGTFTGTVIAATGTFTGTVTATTGSFTGSIFAKSGYLGDPTSGWNFSSAGYLTNNGSTTILYPTNSPGGFASSYAIITERALQADGGLQGSLGCTWNVGGSTIFNSYWKSNARILPFYDNIYSLGASSYHWSALYVNTSTITSSDLRLKKDVTPSILGLSFIDALNPVSYKFINGGNLADKETGEVTTTPGVRTHFGLIAQEVKATLDANYPGQDFSGWVLADPADPNSQQSLRYESFISPLIKAVQELSARVTQLESK